MTELRRRRTVAVEIALTILFAAMTGWLAVHPGPGTSAELLSVAIALMAGLTAATGAIAGWDAAGGAR